MTYKPKRNAALLLSLALLTGCASSVKPSTAQIPPPPAELMAPEDLNGSYLESVQIILQDWRKRLTDWRARS